MAAIRVSCVGDLLPADTAYTMGNGIGSSMNRLIEYYSSPDIDSFTDSDMVFCNLEAPLVFNTDKLKKPFEGNPDVLRLMKILNISVVSVANNHMPDHGDEECRRTVSDLREHGFLAVGTQENGISEIVIKEIKGKRFAFAGFNSINDHPDNKLITQLEREILFSTLAEIKKLDPDYILFSLHWGNEYISWPSPAQVDLAHELIDNGVNVIIGHHPHVVQPIERYRSGIILYSLGNFIFDMLWSAKVRQGILVDLILNEDATLDYNVRPFSIRNDFTQDYSINAAMFADFVRVDNKFKSLQSGQVDLYEKEYLKECKKRRLLSRLQMKLYLLKNVHKMSLQSRNLLLANFKMKISKLWIKN